MIIVMKKGSSNEEIQNVKKNIEEKGLITHISIGKDVAIVGMIGDTTKIDESNMMLLSGVEKIVHIGEPYKKANRRFHPKDTIVNVSGTEIGGEFIRIMAGPCSVESEEQIKTIAKDVKMSGATFLRGGAFKPRTSPYSFQGMGQDGLELLKMAREETGLPIVSEIMDKEFLDVFERDVDIIQVGARNMQNFGLLKALGETNKPILLKRGLSATIEEWLMSAEYIMAGGNENVILCERGIRTFENFTRNTLDLSAIPAVKKLSHLPIIIDPSHAAGMWWMVEPMSKAAIVAGCDGLIIEVHNDPLKAKCDGNQSITPERFNNLMEKLKVLASIENRKI